jgi:hypothetical protein
MSGATERDALARKFGFSGAQIADECKLHGLTFGTLMQIWAEGDAAGFARGVERAKEYAVILATACWRNKRFNAVGMGGQAIHFRAVEEMCKELGVPFEPRDDEKRGAEGE